MNPNRRCMLAHALAAGGVCAFPAVAQSRFPDKPVKIVVPFAVGGASDTFARLIGEMLAERLGQPFLVENRAGAGGTIAANAVARAPADGYTLFVGDIGTHGIASSLYGHKLGYDAVKDFVPISFSVINPLVLVATPSLEATDLRQLIALAKSEPGRVSYASSGSGGISHLAAELLESTAGIDLLHVPYKGGAPALADLMAGQVQLMIPSLSTSVPHIRSGKVRAIAVTSGHRSPLLPDVPTVSEAGLPGYVVEPWLGILAPAGTPKATSDLLQREFAAVLALPAVRDKLAARGFEVAGGNGDDLAQIVTSDVKRWAKIVEQSGAKVE